MASIKEDDPAEPRHLYLVSWEGCLVDTVDWRTQQGLAVCRQVWPDLEVLLSDKDDQQWLFNKVRDLHHVFVLDPEYSPTVEYALLIRMLLEEQELDQGRSNGSQGKYGSKYHPTAADAFTASNEDPSFNRRQQRPLTVGEIATNWQETLREAVLIRYYQEEGQNPLDLLQEAVTKLPEPQPANKLVLKFSDDLEILQRNSGSIVVVSPPYDLPAVKASLQSLDYEVCETAQEATNAPTNNLPVVCRTKTLIRDILESMPENSSLSVFESSWPVLEKNIDIFGDFLPRRTDRPQRCSITSKQLQLSLWRNSHPNSQSLALMSVWTCCRETSEWPRAIQPVTTGR